ncbi:head completion/stabilization protein [Salmonella enterica]|nr:head completion/stabilization protein [Salmonella enterica]EBI0350915.1 head completion/stabilization protein [Salmonella enterica subsp. arizonae serovar 48:z4,z23,z32:-]EBM5794795.1 head completion protein [Salmonella enterica]EBS9963207.1 head completion/stabilization protein [Salmonella enterica]EDZ6957536.1 head completion/stabilization protein [Salmonella enterica]
MFNGKPIEYQDIVVTNDGFWPDLNVKDFQDNRSIPADIAAGTVADALVSAMAQINASLIARRDQWTSLGIVTASAVPGPSYEGESYVVAQYRKAVFARAKADLMGEWTSIVRVKADAQPSAEETREALLAEANFALRSLKGLSRAGVSII